MRNKTISLSEEMFEKLRGEKNTSALIDRLLTKHFETSEKSEEEILKDVNNKITEKITAEERQIAAEKFRNTILEEVERQNLEANKT